jgi:maleate isomerase
MTQRELLPLDFSTDAGFGARALLGLIVLESDRTIEAEMRKIQIAGVDWLHARIHNDDDVTPETLTAMKSRLPEVAALLPPGFDFSALGYGCTSASTLIGETAVTEALQSVHPGVPCTNPVTAAVAAFRSLKAQRIAIVTPYTAEVTAPIVDLFESQGFEVSAVGSFLEPLDSVVCRITEASVADAVKHVATESPCDAVFVSCTSLRLFGVVNQLEESLNKPVVSSNLALTWHLLRLAGINDPLATHGVLGHQRLL